MPIKFEILLPLFAQYNSKFVGATNKNLKPIDVPRINSDKITFACSKCKKEQTLNYINFKDDAISEGSFKCKGCKKKSTLAPQIEIFKKDLEEMIISMGHTLVNGIDEYKTRKDKLTIDCPKGHRVEISPDHLIEAKNNGTTGCGVCIKGRPKNQDWVETLRNNGYEPLETSKTPSTTEKVRCRCIVCGSEVETSIHNASRNSKGCGNCPGIKLRQIAKELLGHDDFYFDFESNSRITINTKCSCGKDISLPFKEFKQQNGKCIRCFSDQNGEHSRFKTGINFKKILEECGYFLLVDPREIRNVAQHVMVKCDNSHEYTTTVNRFSQNHRCPRCAYDRMKPQNPRADFESKGYIMLGEYKNNKDPIGYECMRCKNQGTISYGNLMRETKPKTCKDCYGKMTLDEVSAMLEEQDCELLDAPRDLMNREDKILYKCVCGNRSIISIRSFKNERRCELCTNEARKIKTYANMNNPAVKDAITKKQIETNRRNWGVDWYMQDQDNFESVKTRILYLMPSGNLIPVQSLLECVVLDVLLEKHDEQDIGFDKKSGKPLIQYFYEENRVYYPDFYIKSTNTLIEVKSKFVFDKEKEQTRSKIKYSIEAGYNYKMYYFPTFSRKKWSERIYKFGNGVLKFLTIPH